MSDYRNFRLERDARGVVTAWIDMPGKPVNVFEEGLLRELHQVVQSLQNDRGVKLIVFRSAKPGCFFAGADLNQLESLTNPSDVAAVVNAGQQLFHQIARLPTIAVIDGTCLGGGLEFALACQYRVACDDAATRLGLPETQLGLIPGWGGTQRLPRLIGVGTALQLILEGRRVSGSQAVEYGLVDAAFPREKFESGVQSFINDRLAGRAVERPRSGAMAWIRDWTRVGRHFVFSMARKHVNRKFSHYPALPAAINAIEAGLRHGLERGLQVEREQFIRVQSSSVSKNLRRIFFLREKARKASTWVSDPALKPVSPQTVAVIGAGTMGAGIAQAAAFSGCRVILRDIEQRFVDGGLQKIDTLFRDAVRSGALTESEAQTRRAAITGTVDLKSVAQADLIVEAVVEKLAIKQDVFRELDRIARPDAIIVSNTSALPISELAKVTNRGGSVAGLHFFNPVHKMPLVEIVRTPGASEPTLAALVAFVRQLGKVPLVVSESPGFLVNRVLFPYLDEAVRLVCEGVSVRDVDKAALKFGMPMGPLELLDYVGIDVAADVAQTLSPLASEASPTPERLQQMCRERLLGRKSGMGFYRWQNGKKQKPLPTEHESAASRLDPLHIGGEELSGVQQRLVFKLLNEAAQCLHEQIVREAWMVDLGMVLGTGYAPFRGGPMQTIEDWGSDRCLEALNSLTKHCGPRFTPSVYFKSDEREDARRVELVAAAGE